MGKGRQLGMTLQGHKALGLDLIAAGRQVARKIEAATGSPTSWLEARWAQLKQTRPLVTLPWRSRLNPAGNPVSSLSERAVAVASIVDIDREMTWGHLNNRMHVFGEMLDALLEAHASDDWEPWVKRWTWDSISVHATAALNTEIYRIDTGGRHRSMMAAALELPMLPAQVSRSIAPDPYSPYAVPLAEPFDRRHAESVARAENAEAGAGSGEWVVHPGVDHAIDWWYDAPQHVEIVASAFRRTHPDITLPPEMRSADDWILRFDPTRARRLRWQKTLHRLSRSLFS